MAKLWTYTMILVGVMTLLNLAGVTTTIGSVATWMSDNALVTLIAAITAFTGVLIAASLFGRSIPESAVLGTFAVTLAGFSILDISNINKAILTTCPATTVCNPLATIVSLVLGIFVAGYIIVIAQWWRGNDIM